MSGKWNRSGPPWRSRASAQSGVPPVKEERTQPSDGSGANRPAIPAATSADRRRRIERLARRQSDHRVLRPEAGHRVVDEPTPADPDQVGRPQVAAVFRHLGRMPRRNLAEQGSLPPPATVRPPAQQIQSMAGGEAPRAPCFGAHCRWIMDRNLGLASGQPPRHHRHADEKHRSQAPTHSPQTRAGARCFAAPSSRLPKTAKYA